MPTIAVGRIASSDEASACSWVRPSTSASIGTKMMPPPTPKRPARTPPERAERGDERRASGRAAGPRRPRGGPRSRTRACAGEALLERCRASTPNSAGNARRAPPRRPSPRRGSVRDRARSTMTRIAASEVAAARRSSKRGRRTSSGTITIPPPTPKIALKKPAVRPIGRAGAPARILRGWTPLALLAAEPRRAAIFLDVDGDAGPDRRRGPRTASVPAGDAAGARAPAQPVRARRVRERPAGRRAREIVGVDGPALRRRARARARARGRGVGGAASTPSRARGLAWPETKPLTAAFHYRTRRTRRGARASWRTSQRRRSSGGLAHALGAHGAGGAAAGGGVEGNRGRGSCSTSRGLRRALYAGDDTTDLDGFAALDGLRGRGAGRGRLGGGPVRARRARRRHRRLDRTSFARSAAASSDDQSREQLAQRRDWRRATSSSVRCASSSASRRRSRPGRLTAATLPRLTRWERWMRVKRSAAATPRARPARRCRGTSGRRCGRGSSRRRPARSAPGRSSISSVRPPATTGMLRDRRAFSTPRARAGARPRARGAPGRPASAGSRTPRRRTPRPRTRACAVTNTTAGGDGRARTSGAASSPVRPGHLDVEEDDVVASGRARARAPRGAGRLVDDATSACSPSR